MSEARNAQLIKKLQASKNTNQKLEARIVEKDETIAKEQDLVVELETSLVDTNSNMMVMEAWLQTSDFEVVEGEVIAQEAKDRAQATEAKARPIKAQATSVVARAMEKYKKFKDFEDEITKDSYDTYQLGFMKCKKKVAEAFLGLGIDGIINVEFEKEEGVEG